MWCYKLLVVFSVAIVEIEGNYCSSKFHTQSTCVTDYGIALLDVWKRSRIDCARECSQTPTCQSFLFFEGTRICRQNTGLLTNFSLACAEPNTYGEITGVPTCSNGSSHNSGLPSQYQYLQYPYFFMSDPCITNAECVHIPNSYCEFSICFCSLGYKFDWTTQSCVSSCTVYGNSYQITTGAALVGYDNLAIPNLSEFECLQRCTDETGFQCLSAEWDIDLICYLSTETALTKPGAMTNNTSGNMYHRDCLFV